MRIQSRKTALLHQIFLIFKIHSQHFPFHPYQFQMLLFAFQTFLQRLHQKWSKLNQLHPQFIIHHLLNLIHLLSSPSLSDALNTMSDHQEHGGRSVNRLLQFQVIQMTLRTLRTKMMPISLEQLMTSTPVKTGFTSRDLF